MENIYLILGIFIIGGYFSGILAEKLGLPKITGYILLGVLFSPSLFGFTLPERIKGMGIVTEIALSVIGFIAGGDLRIETVKRLGKSVFWITIAQALGAWIFVGSLVYLLFPLIVPVGKKELFIMALTLGAVSLPTAPAAIVAIIHEFRAKGPLTSTLLSVVILDDAVAIIATSISIAIAKTMVSSEAASPWVEVSRSLVDIGAAILIGVLVGFLSEKIINYFKTDASLLLFVIGSIFFCTGLSNVLGTSYLLSNMIFGLFVANTFKLSDKYFKTIEGIEELLFILFFTLAGAHFEVQALKSAGILSIIIVVSRFAGKYIGSYLGALFSGASSTIRKYIGLALLPKAGVSIGLILLVLELPEIKDVGVIMINGVLASVIINELIAPPLVKTALIKAKETNI